MLATATSFATAWERAASDDRGSGRAAVPLPGLRARVSARG